MEITLHSYSNPTGRCDECQPGTQPGCCDETFVRPAGQLCPSTPTCDTAIEHCAITNDEIKCGAFIFFEANTNIINFEQSTGLQRFENPVIIHGNGLWNVSYSSGC